MTLSQVQSEVEGLEKQIKSTEKDIHALLERRPAAALESQRGKSGSLAALDAEIAKARARMVTLEDALRQARWNALGAARTELVPLLRDRIEAGAQLRTALKHLETALAREKSRREVLFEKARALKLSGKLSGCDPGDFVLARIAAAVGIKIEVPYVHPGLAELEPDPLEEMDAQLGEIIAQFESRAKAPSPPLSREMRPADNAQGFLSAIGASFRKLSELPREAPRAVLGSINRGPKGEGEL